MSFTTSNDPFTGTWTFNASKSTTSFPVPCYWVQHVQWDPHELRLSEDIVLSDGTQFTVSLRAAFDGKDYPVTGSRYADTMAYTRPTPRTVLGTGKGHGRITLRDTVSLAPAGDSPTICLSLYSGGRQFATGTLVSEKS